MLEYDESDIGNRSKRLVPDIYIGSITNKRNNEYKSTHNESEFMISPATNNKYF